MTSRRGSSKTRRTEWGERAQLREALSFSSGRKWCGWAEEVVLSPVGELVDCS